MKTTYDKLKRNYTIEDLEQILDSIPYEVYLKDVNGKYKYINKEAADKVGLKKEDIIGKCDEDFRTKEMAEICTNGDKLTLERGKATFVEDKIVKGNIETAYELFKTIILDSITKEKLICGIAKFVTKDKTVSNYIIEKYGDIMNSSNSIDSEVVHNEILIKLREVTKSDDVALYFYDRELESMKKYINLEKGKNVFPYEYFITDDIKSKYYENNDCVLVTDLDNNKIVYTYILKDNNKLLGVMHIYYENKPSDIKEEFVKYLCLVISFMQNKKNTYR